VVSKFLKRWSSNKLATQTLDEPSVTKPDGPIADPKQTLPVQDDEAGNIASEESASRPSTNEDATLKVSEHDGKTEESDALSVAGLLASGAKGAVKKQALRQLFLSGEFSEVDNLNDYDHDYKAVKSLSQDAAQHLRNWLNEKTDEEAQLDEQQETSSAPASAQSTEPACDASALESEQAPRSDKHDIPSVEDKAQRPSNSDTKLSETKSTT